MTLQPEVGHVQQDLVAVLGGDGPHTLPLVGVVVGVVRAGDDSRGVG